MVEIRSTKPGAPAHSITPRPSVSASPRTTAAPTERPPSWPEPNPVMGPSKLMAGFVAPSEQIASWLSSPNFAATLQAAADTLATGESASGGGDRYAAEIVKTHLAARRRLSSAMNAILKA